MPRARNIKPGFFKNEYIAEVEPQGRLLFIGLWTLADREGRMEYRPKRIKAELFPYEDCDVDSLVSQLESCNFVKRYEITRTQYLQIVNFTKHQKPHPNEKGSEIPPPCNVASNHEKDIPNQASSLNAESLNAESLSCESDDPPAKTNGASKPKNRDEVWDAVLAVCGLEKQSPTKSERGAWNKAVKDLRDAGATPGEIHARAKAYRRKWPGVSLTPNALSRHWSECVASTPTPSDARLESFD